MCDRVANITAWLRFSKGHWNEPCQEQWPLYGGICGHLRWGRRIMKLPPQKNHCTPRYVFNNIAWSNKSTTQTIQITNAKNAGFFVKKLLSLSPFLKLVRPTQTVSNGWGCRFSKFVSAATVAVRGESSNMQVFYSFISPLVL